MPSYPNPPIHLVTPAELGDETDAAAAAGVSRTTIRVWVHRHKITPLITEGDHVLYHLPTVRQARTASRPGRPRKPAAPQAA